MKSPIKIVSDGVCNTKVVWADTGETVRGVTKIEWEIEVGKPSTARITFAVAEADLIHKG